MTAIRFRPILFPLAGFLCAGEPAPTFANTVRPFLQTSCHNRTPALRFASLRQNDALTFWYNGIWDLKSDGRRVPSDQRQGSECQRDCVPCED